MQAKVTTEFPGKPDHEPLSRTIKVDEVIDGDLAMVAVANKWAVEIEAKKQKAPAAGKKPKPRK